MINDSEPFITTDKFLQILMEAYNIGNNGENVTIEWMLNYLENKLK
jgi:hypothetical protein